MQTTAFTPKPTILIVEDEPGPRDALRMILRPFFNLIAVDCGRAAMDTLKTQPVDLVTLDLKLPDQQGVDLLQEIKLDHPDVEAVIITGYGSLKSAMEGIRYGAAGYLLKPFNVTELIGVINQTLAKKRRLTALKDFLRHPAALMGTAAETAKAWRDLADCSRHTEAGRSLEADAQDWSPLLFEVLEAKSRNLFNHCSRVSFYSGLLGKALGLSEPERKSLSLGSFLHDIGMIALPSPDLDAGLEGDAQGEVMKRHPELGARMIAPLHMPPDVGQIISYHHERYDGAGYPFGLQGDGIPLLARVIQIAQGFDHFLSEHPAVSLEDSMRYIRSEGGRAFDPELADLFVQSIAENQAAMPAFMGAFKPVSS